MVPRARRRHPPASGMAQRQPGGARPPRFRSSTPNCTLAARYLSRERQGHTLQTTALVHEAYVKLVDQHSVDWQNRAHFFGIAANLMRRILIGRCAPPKRHKRGAGARPELLDDLPVAAANGLDLVDTIALDRALQELEKLDPEQVATRRTTILWRVDGRGGGGGFGGVTIDREARVGDCQRLALSRDHGRAVIAAEPFLLPMTRSQ